MCRNVILEFFLQKSMNDFWLVVRDTFGETLVEQKEMTGRAGIGKSHRSHQFAARRRIVSR